MGMKKRYGVISHFLFKLGLETYAGFIQQVCLNFAADFNGDKFQPQHAKLSVDIVSERLRLTLPCPDESLGSAEIRMTWSLVLLSIHTALTGNFHNVRI